MTNRATRLVAWGALLAAAAFQAYAQRYAVSPDGISYLDLSDAVVTGRWGGLVNLYWSPLYPFLVGVVRALTGAGAAGEIPAMHALNVAAFAAMLGAFEYFLIPVLSLAATRRSLLGKHGAAAGYALFGAVALTMTPLELTTPDLLSNAAILVALGAMLRLRRRDDAAGESRAAIMIGAALGAGVLAKSFLVPWSLVCFGVIAIDRRRGGRRPLGIAIGVWALFVVPWTAILSTTAGRPTFGDAGRLTYGWYVNGQDAPSLRGAAPGARAADTDALLPGVGVPGDARGTDPMWFDPARWNAPVRPHLSIRDQLLTLQAMSIALLGSLSVLSLIAVLVATAPDGSRREIWRDGWIVFVPAIAGVGGYLMVVLTARYVMAFLLAGILLLLALTPRARRVKPTFVLLGLALAVIPLALSPANALGFSLAVAATLATLVGVRVAPRGWIARGLAMALTLAVSMIVFSPRVPGLMYVAALVGIAMLWIASRVAIRRGTPVAFAGRLRGSLLLSIALVIGARVALRFNRDAQAAVRAGSGSPEVRIAADLRSHGIVPGTRIALVGPHAESYWARTARLRIVANVPEAIVERWWDAPAPLRDSLLARFAERGARVVIATRLPASGSPGPGWTPLRYQGWLRELPQPAR